MATKAAPCTTEELVLRLRRAEGQLRGLQRMLDEGAETPQLLTQLSAVKAAIDQVGLKLLAEELRRCQANGESGCTERFETTLETFFRYTTLAR